MANDLTLGQVGYEAYGEDSGWTTFDGRPMPKWDNLRPDIQARWEISARAIADEALRRSRAETGTHLKYVPEG